ncbi:hypothetical protein BO78DRAFT_426265 [Aspergillus sclerotiicarbonarius CBS 121057]|uniref:Rhodopsin domain-containing protein n=1 Tax=Aspergillus sclerotiicarbonarius (strain CBS 121057 / IBT 28362) TaxID=1448318 RepID=A0A319F4X7_ASPSB|nr:hypothetical protein BO78DRAFT_426265 [Aspergillus sclerotiicarbonarius CBS 121057]
MRATVQPASFRLVLSYAAMGWVHNLTVLDPNSHVPRVIAICLTFSITACLAAAMRLYIRIHTKRSAWVDDFAALWSAVLAMAYGGVAVAQTRWGLGLNSAYFPDENVVMFSKIQYAGGPIYTLALLGFKVSLLSSYLRIGGFVSAYRATIIVAIVAVVCNQLVFTFLLCFACTPVSRQWDMSLPGTCINTVASYYALAGTSLGFDIIIIALPLPVLCTLQLRMRQKIALVGVFALGFFITIIQIIRIFTIKNLKTYTDSQPIVLWSDVEISLGVIITCIPTYGPFFHAFASTMSSSYNQHHNNNNNNSPDSTTSPNSYQLRKAQTQTVMGTMTASEWEKERKRKRMQSRDLADASLDEVARGFGVSSVGLESGLLFGVGEGIEESVSVSALSRSASRSPTRTRTPSRSRSRSRSRSPGFGIGMGGVWDGGVWGGGSAQTTVISSLPRARTAESRTGSEVGLFAAGAAGEQETRDPGMLEAGGGFPFGSMGMGMGMGSIMGGRGITRSVSGTGSGRGLQIQKVMEVRVERE